MEYSGEQFDVVVIGAGVMGSATAYQIAKRGQTVLLLEQFDFLHQLGSSHGESRTIRATYPEDYYSEMVIESSRLWEEAEAEIGYKVYYKTPHLDMGPCTNKSLKAVIETCKSNSIPFRVLDPAEVSKEFCGKFKVPKDWIGLSTGLGGVLKPTKAVSMFQTLAIRRGAVLKDNMKATEIVKDQKSGNVLVTTSNGRNFFGKKCVITVGSWMKKLVKGVTAIDLPIQPLHTTICYWRIKEAYKKDFTMETGFPTFSSYDAPYIYGTPCFDFPGLIKIAVHGGYPCDPDKRTWAPTQLGDSVTKWIETRFSGRVDSSGPVHIQSCMYSMTPDGDYLIDFLGGEFGKDVVVAGGFSGHGFKMGPVIGRILADLVLDGETEGVDMKHFRLERFEGNPKGNVKEFEDQVSSQVEP